MDLFFYREPEEAKQQDEDAIVASDYGITDYSAATIGGIPGDQWHSQITDVAIPAVPSLNWTGEAG